MGGKCASSSAECNDEANAVAEDGKAWEQQQVPARDWEAATQEPQQSLD